MRVFLPEGGGTMDSYEKVLRINCDVKSSNASEKKK